MLSLLLYMENREDKHFVSNELSPKCMNKFELHTYFQSFNCIVIPSLQFDANYGFSLHFSFL